MARNRGQFRPGQIANPSGRPKLSEEVRSMHQVALEQIEVEGNVAGLVIVTDAEDIQTEQ